MGRVRECVCVQQREGNVFMRERKRGTQRQRDREYVFEGGRMLLWLLVYEKKKKKIERKRERKRKREGERLLIYICCGIMCAFIITEKKERERKKKKKRERKIGDCAYVCVCMRYRKCVCV